MSFSAKAVRYVMTHPGCSATQLAVAQGITLTYARAVLVDMRRKGLVEREEKQRRSVYVQRVPVCHRFNNGYEQARELAIELENRGLWRRAARQWLIAMDKTNHSASQERAAFRRRECLMKVAVVREVDGPQSFPLNELVWRVNQ